MLHSHTYQWSSINNTHACIRHVDVITTIHKPTIFTNFWAIWQIWMKFGTGHATQLWYQLQATFEAYSSTFVSQLDVWIHFADDLQGNGLTVVAPLQLYVALIVTYPWQQPQNFVAYQNFNIHFLPIQIPCFNVSQIQNLIFILHIFQKCVIRSLMTSLHLKKNYTIRPSSCNTDAFIHKTKFILHPFP